MTVLSAQSIRRRMCRDIIKPFHERTVVNGMTFGLSGAGYDIRCAENIHLLPNLFALASSVERFKMPLDLVAEVKDKSTWARRGLFVQNTVIEPGWCGHLTLELSAHAKIEVKAGDPIAQIIFYKLDHETEQGYSGKYQDQKSGPQPPILEDNKND